MLNLHNLTEEVNSSQIGRAVRLGEVGRWKNVLLSCVLLRVSSSKF